MRSRPRDNSGLNPVITLLAIGLTVTTIYALTRTQPRGPGATRTHETLANAIWPDLRIDLNHATEAELMLLSGIGPGLARRIVEDREQGEFFESIDALQRVHGIGPLTVQRLRHQAVVTTPTSATIPGPDRAGTAESD